MYLQIMENEVEESFPNMIIMFQNISMFVSIVKKGERLGAYNAPKTPSCILINLRTLSSRTGE